MFIEIRKATINDFDEIMRIWEAENIRAHNFIPSDYWKQNYRSVKEALPQAEIYVSVYRKKIIGFIGVNGNFIEGIFVESNKQHKGVGSLLLKKLKELKTVLTLSVYKKNVNAVNFYLYRDFVIINDGIDERTSESEFTMQWVKKSE